MKQYSIVITRILFIKLVLFIIYHSKVAKTAVIGPLNSQASQTRTTGHCDRASALGNRLLNHPYRPLLNSVRVSYCASLWKL